MSRKIKNLFHIFFAITLVLGSFFVATKIYAENKSLDREAIVDFSSDISVNGDNSVDVIETIVYSTGPLQRHGIYRDIYPYSSQNRKMTIENVIVTDGNNQPIQYQVSNEGKNFRIKIGDPNQTFNGEKIYLIKYRATRAVAQLKDFDEIYWNVTGNEWNIPILKTEAHVLLPSGLTAIQSSCYYGQKGSTSQCQSSEIKNNSSVFNAPSGLNPYEGLTVAVGFPKGVVIPYSSADSVSNFFEVYKIWFFSAILPLLTLILSLLYWHKKGRDPKGTGVIVPQYDVPYDLTPMEVGAIVNEKINSNDISAEIIYLATKGYIKIKQTETRFLGLIKRTDYELTKTKDFSDLPNFYDRELLKDIFFKPYLDSFTNPDQNQMQTVKLSDLKKTFYVYVRSILKLASDSLLDKGYYKNLGSMESTIGMNFSSIALAMRLSIAIGILVSFTVFQDDILPFCISIFISFVIYLIVSKFTPAKTEKGVAILEHILGLKDYLQIAEKDRLLFHNAPEKKPEIFEKLLPYAMVLGVAKIWAKEFEDIYTTPPSWYTGSPGSSFNSVTFNRSISNFGYFAASSLSSVPGGSGGGGSSGGGGGGGGGGGW